MVFLPKGFQIYRPQDGELFLIKKKMVYYFEDALSPNAIWVDLKKMDFSKNGKVKKLALDNNQIYAGETSANFVDTKPFVFQGI